MSAPSGHTPGPWKLKREGTIADSEGDLIATCGYRCRVGSTEDDDNARLIVAAPDLLAACDCGVCGGAGYVICPPDLSAPGGIYPCPDECGEKRRAAIAKARP